MSETYTTEQASKHALEWCVKHKGWKRICDIGDTEKLYYSWDELSEIEKNPWIKDFGEYSAESAWREFGKAKCKVKNGYISGKGEFYDDVLKVPMYHNLMTVFKISELKEESK